MIFGAGVAGIGIANLIRDVMIEGGLSAEDATRRFWCVDSHGLLTTDLGDRLQDFQAGYARPAAGSEDLARCPAADNRLGRSHSPRAAHHADRRFGSGRRVSQKRLCERWRRHAERPMIFPLSSPPAMAEATPADLINWTDGRALIATGSPFTPVTHKGITHVIGQAENAMLYPGLGLGAIVSRSRLVSVGMLAAAANALSSMVAVRLPGASLLPLHRRFAKRDGNGGRSGRGGRQWPRDCPPSKLVDIVQQVEDAIWQPEYRRIQAI